MESLASTKGPSVTILDLPRTTLPVPSNRSPACLKWPFFFRVSAQPIHFFVSCCICSGDMDRRAAWLCRNRYMKFAISAPPFPRSEEHTSELQSLTNLVCRLLLEKKKKYRN